MFDGRIFFLLYILTISAILDCQFIFDRRKGMLVVIGMLFDILLFEKMDRSNCIQFYEKN